MSLPDRVPILSARAIPGHILGIGLAIAGTNAWVLLALALSLTFELQDLKWSLQGAAGVTSFAAYYSIPSVAGAWLSGRISSVLAARSVRAARLIASGLGAGVGVLVAWSGYLLITLISPIGRIGAGNIQFLAQPFLLTTLWFSVLFAWLGHRLTTQAVSVQRPHRSTGRRNYLRGLAALGTTGTGAVLSVTLLFSVFLGAPLAQKVEIAAGLSPEIRRYCSGPDMKLIAQPEIQWLPIIGDVLPLPSGQWEVVCSPWLASDRPIIHVDLRACEASVITFSFSGTYKLNHCP